MNPGTGPRFLSREAVDAIHEDQIERFGGGFLVFATKTR